MDTHPDNAPLGFVTPTPDMLIRPSINVDANGRVYLPYLQEWKYVRIGTQYLNPSYNIKGGLHPGCTPNRNWACFVLYLQIKDTSLNMLILKQIVWETKNWH